MAEVLRQRGLGTLLFDLLTEEEDREYGNRFDIPLITRRMEEATRWVRESGDHCRGSSARLNSFRCPAARE